MDDRRSTIDDRVPTPVDLFLSADLTEAQAHAYLESLGFRDPARVDGDLQRMADDPVVREALGRLAADLIHALLEAPDPDAAVAGLSQYVAARSGRAMFLDYLREDPRALHVLTYVMGASPVLGDILIRTPEYFHWLVAQVERSAPDRQDHEEELVSALGSVDDPLEALNVLRRWKRRETLRIGTRELLGRETVEAVAVQLSDIACVAIEFSLAIVMHQLLDADGREKPSGIFAVIATGELGAHEMAYSSDIQLLYVYDAPAADLSAARAFWVRVGCDLTAVLRDETHEGSLYHVALPQWCQQEACSLDECGERYAASHDHEEQYTLARVRPVAGDPELGRRFIACSQPFAYRAAGESASYFPEAPTDPSAGDIDRLTHVFQLRHGAAHAALRHGGTLATLAAMGSVGLIDEASRRELDHAYVFLRSAEHRRQLGLKDDADAQVAASRERVREICRSLV